MANEWKEQRNAGNRATRDPKHQEDIHVQKTVKHERRAFIVDENRAGQLLRQFEGKSTSGNPRAISSAASAQKPVNTQAKEHTRQQRTVKSVGKQREGTTDAKQLREQDKIAVAEARADARLTIKA